MNPLYLCLGRKPRPYTQPGPLKAGGVHALAFGPKRLFGNRNRD